jgi:cyanophycinase-like exopeptidase
MLNLLAIWRAHRLDSILREAWGRGIVLAGQSAGAMCWFEWGVTRSASETRLTPGLALVPGLLSVHYMRDPDRRQVLLAEVAARRRVGFGLDDGAGLLVRGTETFTAVSGREDARVCRVGPDGRGRARETELAAVPLPSPRIPIDEPGADVIEMRRLRSRRAAYG